MTTVGIISDTHGLLRPEAVQELRGVDQILHAGDIGSESVLEELQSLAPVTSVRGNMDSGSWAKELPETEVVAIEEIFVYMLHDLMTLDLDPRTAGFGVVISGHSHAPRIEEADGVIYLNPGAAGHRRFRLPVSLARLVVDGKKIQTELVTLDV